MIDESFEIRVLYRHRTSATPRMEIQLAFVSLRLN